MYIYITYSTCSTCFLSRWGGAQGTWSYHLTIGDFWLLPIHSGNIPLKKTLVVLANWVIKKLPIPPKKREAGFTPLIWLLTNSLRQSWSSVRRSQNTVHWEDEEVSLPGFGGLRRWELVAMGNYHESWVVMSMKMTIFPSFSHIFTIRNDKQRIATRWRWFAPAS